MAGKAWQGADNNYNVLVHLYCHRSAAAETLKVFDKMVDEKDRREIKKVESFMMIMFMSITLFLMTPLIEGV